MKVTVEIEGSYKCELFAKFLKRITFEGVRECAIDKEETYEMLAVIENIQGQLAEQGFAPR